MAQHALYSQSVPPIIFNIRSGADKEKATKNEIVKLKKISTDLDIPKNTHKSFKVIWNLVIVTYLHKKAPILVHL